MCGVLSGGTYRLIRLADNKIRVQNFLVGNVSVVDGSVGVPLKHFDDLNEGMRIELHVRGHRFPIREVVESINESKTSACLRQLA